MSEFQNACDAVSHANDQPRASFGFITDVRGVVAGLFARFPDGTELVARISEDAPHRLIIRTQPNLAAKGETS